MLEVTRYSDHKSYTKKRKLQIDGWFLNVLHMLGQEKPIKLKTRLLQLTVDRGA